MCLKSLSALGSAYTIILTCVSVCTDDLSVGQGINRLNLLKFVEAENGKKSGDNANKTERKKNKMCHIFVFVPPDT